MSSDTVTISRTYELRPNKQMKAVFDRNCDYRRYCWNTALEIWNDMYQARAIMIDHDTRLLIAEHYKLDHALKNNHKMKAKTRAKKAKRLRDVDAQITDTDWELAKINPSPNWRTIRDMMVADKQEWQNSYSARIMQLAIQDLGKAFANFFNQAQANWGHPEFRSRFEPRQGFKSDRVRIENGKIVLDQPRGVKDEWDPIEMSEEPLSNKFGVVSFYREHGKYYASIPFKVDCSELTTYPLKNKHTGVDRNVGRFVTLDGVINVCPKRFQHVYEEIKCYQRILAKKREVNGQKKAKYSKNYQRIRIKLQRAYRKAHNIQNDLMHKFTNNLIQDYSTIVIEDLNVQAMKMTHIASKGLHRSMFGLFARLLKYKCEWYGRTLILADRFYPSTQRCPYCGNVKKGDERVTLEGNKKHHTEHEEYICYNPECPMYNVVQDRDYSAALALDQIVEHPEINHRY